jgi:hypothetical protein
MAKHLPDYHSPLLALGKKVLLWLILPAVILLAIEEYPSGGFLFGTTKPLTAAEMEQRRLAAERVAALKDAPAIIGAEKLKASLTAQDDAATLREHVKKIFVLSGEKLEGEELKIVLGMTLEQLAEYKQKRLDRLNGSQKAAYVLALQEDAKRKLAASPPAATTVVATCDKPDDNLITGRDARLVRDGADYKIVLLGGVKVPKGSVVTGRDGTVIATATAEDTTEFSIQAKDIQKTGKLSVKKNKDTPDVEAYVHVIPTDMRCLRPKGI